LTTIDYETIEEQHQLTTYRKLPITLIKGSGMHVYDSTGREYLDLYGGHAVASTGHCHPTVVKAVQEQTETFIFYSNSTYNDRRALYSQKLAAVAQEGFNKSFFCNSGAEANETALKIARRFTSKTDVISTVTGFHGRTIGSLSATGLGTYRKMFQPIIEDYTFAEFGSIESIESQITDNTAAVIVEPVQSLAGVYVGDTAFYQDLRQLCTDRGVVLIFDEVQTAPGRTGYMFAGSNWDVIPDVISTAKGIASGFPMGVTLVQDHIAETISYGEHGSTFGGGPVVCAAALATIQVIEEENLLETIRTTSANLIEQLSAFEQVKEVRGLGYLLGIETVLPAKDVQKGLFDAGILVGSSSEPSTIRLLPPLITQQEHFDQLVDALGKVFEAGA